MKAIIAAIQIADVLRNSDDNPDFLKWWFDTYGTQVVSSAGHASCAIFPDYPPPTTEAELDWFAAKFNRRYPELVTIGRHRKCSCTPRR